MTDTPRKDTTTTSADPSGQIRQDIEHTRRELGDTAEALAHKVNVPERVKTKARETREKATVKAAEVTEQARHAAQHGTEALQTKATEAAGKARAMSDQAIAQLPVPAQQRARQLMTVARERPAETAAVAVVVYTMLKRMLRRRSRA